MQQPQTHPNTCLQNFPKVVGSIRCQGALLEHTDTMPHKHPTVRAWKNPKDGNWVQQFCQRQKIWNAHILFAVSSPCILQKTIINNEYHYLIPGFFPLSLTTQKNALPLGPKPLCEKKSHSFKDQTSIWCTIVKVKARAVAHLPNLMGICVSNGEPISWNHKKWSHG